MKPDGWDKLARDMTIREAFTLVGMQGLLASDTGKNFTSAKIAEWACEAAEATLAELYRCEQERAKQ